MLLYQIQNFAVDPEKLLRESLRPEFQLVQVGGGQWKLEHRVLQLSPCARHRLPRHRLRLHRRKKRYAQPSAYRINTKYWAAEKLDQDLRPQQ